MANESSSAKGLSLRDRSLCGSYKEEQWSASDSFSSGWLHPVPQGCKPVDRVAAYQCAPPRASLRAKLSMAVR